MGDNDENPWESVSNDEAFREQAEAQTRGGAPQNSGEPSTPAITSVRWDIDENNHSSNNGNDVSFLTNETGAESRRGARASCSKCLSKCSLSYFLHVWDIVLTSFWMTFVGYHLYYNKQHEQSRSLSMDILLVLCIVLSVLNALRGFLWIWASLPAISTICCCGCCFVDDNRDNGGVNTVSKLATNFTLLLGIVYGSVAGAAWSGPPSWLPWCAALGPWCSKLIHAKTVMKIALTTASAIELLRWIFFQGQLSSASSVSMERNRSPDYYNDEFSTPRSESSQNRPWWIGRGRFSNNSDGLNDPLLGSNGQPSWTTTSWMPFGTRGRSRTNEDTSNLINGDEEDVGSVLDSLGEDWASRAESDPYWWTR